MTNRKLAEDPNTDPETLDRLANVEDYDVRLWVARNPNTSPETLDRLADYADDGDFWVRYWVAANLNTQPKTLDRLAKDENWPVGWRVSKNHNTPQYIKDYFKVVQFMKCHKSDSKSTKTTVQYVG